MDPKSFLNSALVQWVQKFSAEIISYQEITDGIYLNEVLQQIDPSISLNDLITRVEENSDRLNNWEVILKNITTYYQDVLQQILVMRPPNVYCIAVEHESDEARDEMCTVLKLLLYASVHCERREEYVEWIRTLDVDSQASLVLFIQQVADQVLPPECCMNTSEEALARNNLLHHHIQNLLVQRGSYLQEVKGLKEYISQTEKEASLRRHTSMEIIYRASPTRAGSSSPTGAQTPSGSDRQHLGVEVAELRAKLRQLREEIDDKNDTIAELQEDLNSVKQVTHKLRNENMNLIQDAKAAKSYRDELDILRDKVIHVNKLESESQRLKEKLTELDFYKARVDELRADNDVLLENRRILEDQVTSCHKRIESIVSLESQLHSYSQQIKELTEERDNDRARIAHLLEENSQLLLHESLKHESDSESSEDGHVTNRLRAVYTFSEPVCKPLYSSNPRAFPHSIREMSLADQLNEVSASEILRLQLANQQLRAELDELKCGTGINCQTDKNLCANERYTSGRNSSNGSEDSAVESDVCQKPCAESDLVTCHCGHSDKDMTLLKQENEFLQKSLDVLKQTASADVEKLKKEKCDLENKSETLRTKLTEKEKMIGEGQSDRLHCVQLEHEVFERTSEVHRKEQEISQLNERLESNKRELLEVQTTSDDLRIQVEGLGSLQEELKRERERAEELRRGVDRITDEKFLAEKELRKMKKLLEERERKVESLSKNLKTVEAENKLSAGLCEKNKELERKLEEIQRENVELCQKSVLDRNTLSALREDLVREKIRYQEQRGELENLRAEIKCYEMKLEKEGLLQELLSNKDDIPWQNLESRMEEVFLRRIETLEEKMKLLNSELAEEKHEKKELQDKIKCLSPSKLEVWNNQNASLEPKDARTVCVTQRYIQSPTSAKDGKSSHIHTCLNISNKATDSMKEIPSQQSEKSPLKFRTQSLLVGEAPLFGLSGDKSSNKNEPERLAAVQEKLSKLEVENTALVSQNTSLAGQVGSLRNDIKRLETELQSTYQRSQDSVSALESQRGLYDTLQSIHDRLSHDYEVKSAELSELKHSMKRIKSELKQQQEINIVVSREKETVAAMKKELEQKQEQRRRGEGEGGMEGAYWRVKEENFQLLLTADRLHREQEETRNELRHCRTALGQLKHVNNELSGKLDESQTDLNSAKVELAKLLSHCEVLAPLNVRLEEENRSLLNQLQALTNQNQELLTSMLYDRASSNESKSAFIERLSEVKQQKEVIQKKMLAQSQRFHPVDKKNESFASALMRKARLIVSGKSRDKLSEDSSSLGSDSLYNDTSRSSETGAGRVDTHNNTRYSASSDIDLLHNSDCIPKHGSPGRLYQRTDSIRITMINSQKHQPPQSLSSPAARPGTSKSPQVRAKSIDFSDKDGEDSDDNKITLGEFLKECDNSPKTRRRLMVEKQITLDDVNKDIVTLDALTSSLSPRAPTIHPEPRSTRRAVTPGARPSQSEWNISSAASKLKESRRQSFNVLPKYDDYGERTLRERKEKSQRKFDPSSQSNLRACKTLPRGSTVNSFREENKRTDKAENFSANEYPQNNYMNSPQFGYADSSRTLDTRRQSLEPTGFYRRKEAQYHGYNSVTPDEENYGRMERKGTHTSTPVKSYQRARSVDQHELHLRAIERSEPQTEEPVSQYEPGKLRNLVQSLQDSVRPGGTPQRESMFWTKQTPDGPSLIAPNEINQFKVDRVCSNDNVCSPSTRQSVRPNSAVDNSRSMQNSSNFTRIEKPIPIRPTTITLPHANSSPGVESYMASRPLPARPASTTPYRTEASQAPRTASMRDGASSQRSRELDGNICVVRPASGRIITQAESARMHPGSESLSNNQLRTPASMAAGPSRTASYYDKRNPNESLVDNCQPNSYCASQFSEDIHKSPCRSASSDPRQRVSVDPGNQRSGAERTGQGHLQGNLQGHAQGHLQGQAQSHLQGHAQGHAQGQTQDHSQGHTQDHSQRHTQGHLQGHAQGNSQGHAQGHSQRHLQGHAQGQAQGYSKLSKDEQERLKLYQNYGCL